MAINMPNIFLVQLDEVTAKVAEAQSILQEAQSLAMDLPATSAMREATAKAIATTIGKNVHSTQETIAMIGKVHQGVAHSKMAAPMIKRRVESLGLGMRVEAILVELHKHVHGDWKFSKSHGSLEKFSKGNDSEIQGQSRKFGNIGVSLSQHGNNIKVVIVSQPPEAFFNYVTDADHDLPIVIEEIEANDPDYAETIALMVKHEIDKQEAFIPTLIKKYKIRMASLQKIASLEARIASLQAILSSR